METKTGHGYEHEWTGESKQNEKVEEESNKRAEGAKVRAL